MKPHLGGALAGVSVAARTTLAAPQAQTKRDKAEEKNRISLERALNLKKAPGAWGRADQTCAVQSRILSPYPTLRLSVETESEGVCEGV